jgi:hypothetical protein
MSNATSVAASTPSHGGHDCGILHAKQLAHSVEVFGRTYTNGSMGDKTARR